MKKTIILASISLLTLACNNKAEEVSLQHNSSDLSQGSEPKTKFDPATGTTIEFEHTEYDFGVIEPNKKVQHYYVFTNTGTNPLQNLHVEVGCGCTTPYVPTKPILPGKKDSIMLEFNPAGQMPEFAKQSTVTANIQEPILLRFKGEIGAEGQSQNKR